jgi:hypothetical protein
MNIIYNIVGKDIGSIIYKYLTISRNKVKIENWKLCGYLENANMFMEKFTPKIMKQDNKMFIKNWEWYNGQWILHFHRKKE